MECTIESKTAQMVDLALSYEVALEQKAQAGTFCAAGDHECFITGSLARVLIMTDFMSDIDSVSPIPCKIVPVMNAGRKRIESFGLRFYCDADDKEFIKQLIQTHIAIEVSEARVFDPATSSFIKVDTKGKLFSASIVIQPRYGR